MILVHEMQIQSSGMQLINVLWLLTGFASSCQFILASFVYTYVWCFGFSFELVVTSSQTVFQGGWTMVGQFYIPTISV